jgi:hypothetical protein
MRSATFAPVLTALMALLTGAPSWAGSADRSVSVSITLSQPGGSGGSGVTPVPPQPSQPSQRAGVCYSRSLSEQTRASVQVVCDSGQFVSIEAVPGQPFLGVHGGAFRYAMSIDRDRSVYEAAAKDPFGWRTGWGTVTMLRLYDVQHAGGPGDFWADRPLELLVSF